MDDHDDEPKNAEKRNHKSGRVIEDKQVWNGKLLFLLGNDRMKAEKMKTLFVKMML